MQEIMAKNQNRMEEDLDSIGKSQVRLEESQSGLAENQRRTEEKLDNFIIEIRSGFSHVQSRLDENEGIFSLTSNKIHHSEVDIAHLLQKTEIHDFKISNLEKKMEDLSD